MLFNSFEFAVFLPIVFFLYWAFVNKKEEIRFQNILICLASYFFYSVWSWKFTTLILLSTFIDYSVGISLSKETRKHVRKALLLISIFANLGLLLYFKYCNFFIDNINELSSLLGLKTNYSSLNIILPVGISFYTFQTMSYTIDVYREKLDATKNFFAFAAFVSFFPQLVAGPIERATNLLPQFHKKRKFDYAIATDGLRQMLWGLFKKVVIADSCAEYVDIIFNTNASMSGSTLFIGAILFAFQIYGDFSGYSDIAIGASKLFGIHLKRNFNYPYFSRDIAEFWRRWHISLSTWFKDYLYIPLGGSHGGTLKKIRNVFAIFLVSGFWHGANWTFIIWGALNAIYFLPLLLLKRNRNNIENIDETSLLPSYREAISILSTFSLTCLAWVFFRAESLQHSLSILKEIFSISLFTIPSVLPVKELALIVLMLACEWISRTQEHPLVKLRSFKSPIIRWAFYLGIIFIIYLFQGKQQDFIYFQF